jgi:TRAP-type mannitol/chloroaromatic compound transport system substrate-binding protein
MVTAWPRGLPGPGVTAQRLCDRIKAMSAGRLQITLYAAGELVPALETFDAVESGAADAAHTAAFYWQGKMPAANFFTTVPFGLLPEEHDAWLDQGGGQALWDTLYGDFGIKPFVGGNTGPSMAGWFKRPIETPDDLRGLKIRVQGLGGEVYRRMGATPVSTAAGEIFQSLQTGVIDAVEFLSPASDLALGLARAAPLYAWPGFDKPNGSSEFLVGRKVWDRLAPDLQAIVVNACRAEAAFALGEIRRLNEAALAKMLDDGVKLMQLPEAMLRTARGHADAILAELGATSPLAGKILESYDAARARAADWSRISTAAFLDARRV